ncbi:MAG: hypothetical protein IKU15_06060 [Clostridia bacterium]|nr:hypothetical protein [Clostridia bacterium]
MNFLTTKTYKVKATGIDWDLYDEETDALLEAEDLPVNEILEVETCIDPYERWNEEGFTTGYEMLCDDVVDTLTEKYGFLINGIDDIEVIEEVA